MDGSRGVMDAPGWRLAPRGGWPLVARVAIAAAVSAGLCGLLAQFAAPSLSGPTDIVGFPTFANYNFGRQFWYYRLTVYAFPALTIVAYLLLARFGPLRSRGARTANRTIRLVEPAPIAPAVPAGPSWSALTRILLPAAVVVTACSARTGHTDLSAVAAGIGYVAMVLVAAGVAARQTEGHLWRALSAANGVGGAVAAVLSLWFVSAHTVVHTVAGMQSWPWLVWWAPVLAVIGILWWTARQLRSGRVARDVELTLLTVVVGAIALFLTISLLPGQVTHFQGFDDAHEMVGASLLTRGYFPWRDMLFVHGLFPDVLTGSLGRAIFGDSIWGAFAIHTVILVPLFWVSAYLFGVWVSRRNPWFLALTFLWMSTLLGPLLVSERFAGPSAELVWSERFIGVPVVLVVLGETLRRRNVVWAVGLTLLLFVEEVLVPETIFVAGPTLACVVAADLVDRQPGRSTCSNLRLTRWCLGTGLAATAAWAAFLAAFHSLGAFVDYYLVFGPGHNLAGAIPPTGTGLMEWTMLAIEVACVLLTIWGVAIKSARRADWEARDWVAVAAAGFVALYLEKALGRFDTEHVWQVFGAGLPLVVLWTSRLVDRLGRAPVNDESGPGARPAARRFLRPVAAFLVVAAVIGFAFAGPLRSAPGQHRLAGVAEGGIARLGYADPGAIDPGLLRDLDTTISAYAGDHGPVFDMTNSPGYLYFLLGRAPGTRFVHVSMAVPRFAQGLLIGELKVVRPPVVIYDAASIGMPVWDGISADVRHYEVSEYILRGWSPVLRTHGVLVMVRNDLIASKSIPVLGVRPQTKNLYFAGPSCDWGSTPNYLPVPDGRQATTVPVRPAARRMIVHYSGWAVDPTTNRPAATVLVADGDRVLGAVTPTTNRPELARYFHQPNSLSGFHYDAVFDDPVTPSAYLVGADGLAHPLGGSPAPPVTSLRLPDGSHVRVATTGGGHLEVHDANMSQVGEIRLPGGMNLRDYDLATLSAAGQLGGATVALTDRLGDPAHDISATWLDQSGPHLALRAGSCPQWYGYDPSNPLYVVQTGGPMVMSVTLSAMRDHVFPHG